MANLSTLELLIKNMKATTEKFSTPSSWDEKTFSEDLKVLFPSRPRMPKMLSHTVQNSYQTQSSGGALQKGCP